MKQYIHHFILGIALLCIGNKMWSQSKEVEIAKAYFLKSDYEKAYDYFKKQIKNPTDRKYIYSEYVICIKKLQAYADGNKQLEKLIDEEPNNWDYPVDKLVLLKEQAKSNEADQFFKNLMKQAINNKLHILTFANTLQLRKMNVEATQVLLQTREAHKQQLAYAKELASLYKMAGNKQAMVDEWMNWMQTDDAAIESVQNDITTTLTSKTEQDYLLDKLYVKVVEKDQNPQYAELMVWIYMQRKDFYNAFLQLRGLDKRKPELRGTQLIELGDVAQKNRDYKMAEQVYSYVTQNYPNEFHYENTQRKLIFSQEIQAKETYPVDTLAIQKIITNYEELLLKSRDPEVAAEILISQAELQGQYLNQLDKAQIKVNLVLDNSRFSSRKKAEAKMLLGDIYLLKGETGDALLTYMQIERDNEDDDMGQEAKLRTAKVSYYDSEFEMAQQHLDILKKATTRKIANDAQDLSLLIKGNYTLDTIVEPMTMYAQTELLIYQHKYQAAMDNLNLLSKQYPNHSLKDEIWYQKAQIYQRTNQHMLAQEALLLVIKDKDCILADDALHQLALINDYKLNDAQKAKDFYKQMLIDFPGSIYVAEARKRFYEL
jgi:outer membrane protein assembly factor BamD (BamD/ComL family)